ncbi:hypothetical protein BVC71_03745 [Marivivens niveibacter]|uniref:Uncharacterized protein n=1 Tax=Marivivens niveibacter TaxID=1930667 RepID=A0A251X2H3_9RHOB|nr:STAS domain-containing protein [Marivivens niveibacter]OUD10615.1 hypothetical protein BVC71_03745 [Marivivens niveibacter]
MPISLTDTEAVLSGDIDITDVDALHPWLTEHRGGTVDLTDCKSAHTAVVQLLIAAKANIKNNSETNDWRSILSNSNSYLLQ